MLSIKTLLLSSILLVILITPTISAEDKPWRVGNIFFIGNEKIPSLSLISTMSQKPSILFIKGAKFSLIDLLDDVGKIQSHYKSKGYLNAAVKIQSIHYDSTNYKVNIVIAIDEGEQTKINRIEFSGKVTLDNFKPLKIIAVSKGSPLDSEALTKSRLNLLDTFANHGFWYADIQYSYSIDRDNALVANITFFINQGPVVLAGDTYYKGFSKVKTIVAQREILFKKDDVLSTGDVRRSIQKIYDTGLFTAVTVQPVDTLSRSPLKDTLILPILIDVTESDMILLSAGGGYDAYAQFYLSLSLGYKNLFKTGHHISIEGKVSKVLKAAYLDYSYPWISGKPINGVFSSYVERQNQESFQALFNGGSASINGNFRQNNIYGARLRLNHTQWLHLVPGTETTNLPPKKSTLALAGSIRHDSRRSVTQPGTSLYTSLFTEIAGPFIPWSNQFYKGELDLRHYTAINENRFSISSAVFFGYVNGYGHDMNSVPPQDLFRAGFGSVRPVRGYLENEVSPIDSNGNSTGGKVVLILNLIEGRVVLYKWFTGAIFFDGGKVWANLSNFSLKDLRWAIGPGIMANTSIGLLRLDYGIQLHHSPKGRVLFSAGLPF